MAKEKTRKPAAAARKKTTAAKRSTPVKKAARKKAAAPAKKKAAPARAKKAAPARAKKAAPARAKKAAPASKAMAAAPKARKPAPRVKRAAASAPPVFEEVETTSAGLQPLAPEHAAVDELTSSGNELLDIFQRYDRNRTGYIERREFARLLEALGQNITDEELDIAFDEVDTDGTGRVSWNEFKQWWTSR